MDVKGVSLDFTGLVVAHLNRLLNLARVDEIDVCVSFLLNLFGETC